MKKRTFMEVLKERTVLFDGAMGSLLLSQDLSIDDFRGKEGCCEILNVTRPELVEQAHRIYLEAGADAVETNTFQGSRLKLAELGLEDSTHEINLAAARNARRAADSLSKLSHPRFVVGSMGPTGRLPSSSDPDLSCSFSRIKDVVLEQAFALIEGGVDALLLETQQDIAETRAGIFGVKAALKRAQKNLPILVHIALDENGRMLMGTEVSAAVSILEGLRVDVVGIDCSFGPLEMREFVRHLARDCSVYTACVPNAGLPENRDGNPFYPLGAGEMAEALVGLARECGLDIIGGCCGTTPAHIREIHRELERSSPTRRKVKRLPSVASSYRRVFLEQEPRPLLIGERLNITGSRKTRELVEAGDYEGIVSVAAEQEEQGSHLLDICMAGSAEREWMEKCVRMLSQSVKAPLVIDSRDEDVIRAALELYPGRAVVNSVNLERGEKELSRMLHLVREHGACAVAMTITEDGMALTATEKVAAVHRMRDIAVKEVGLAPDDLLFDCLTLPLSTGDRKYRDSADQTLKGIANLKEESTDYLTVLGVSNVSYGLSSEARKLLNSTFLHHAIALGLDAAIVNPGELIPYHEIPLVERELCEDLIFNRDDHALSRLLEVCEGAKPDVAVGKPVSAETDVRRAIRSKILDRETGGLEDLLDKALSEVGARELLNRVLLPAMEEVGRRFDTGDMILPFVLQASEVMRRAVGHLEKHLGSADLGGKGKIVLATVFGDVHDIGKNLVKAVISNSGYTVYDLGKRVPVDEIVVKARETNSDAIGLSALLVSTSREMKACVRELSRRGMDIPVIVGGAVVNQTLANRISILRDGSTYKGGVFYARDAFDGLDILGRAVEDRAKLLEGYEKRIAEFVKQESVPRDTGRPGTRHAKTMEKVTAPSRGTRTLKDIPPEEVFPYLNTSSLFRGRWGARSGYSADLRNREFLPALEDLKERLTREGRLELSSKYGYFDCHLSGQTLSVSHAEDQVELLFPEDSELLDYFLPGGERDVVALGAVTVGPKVKELEDEFAQSGKTKKAYYLHGLASELAEALAKSLEVRIGMELGLHKGMGRRYSPGFSSWPDLSEQVKLFAVLAPGEIGVTLTESYQMVPEHSISFLFCPRARGRPREGSR